MNGLKLLEFVFATLICFHLWVVFPVMALANNFKRRGSFFNKLLWFFAIALLGPFAASIYGILKGRGTGWTIQGALCVLTIYGAFIFALMGYNSLRRQTFENLEVLEPQLKSLPESFSSEMRSKINNDVAVITQDLEGFRWWDGRQNFMYNRLTSHLIGWLADGNLSLEEYTQWSGEFNLRKSIDMKGIAKELVFELNKYFTQPSASIPAEPLR